MSRKFLIRTIFSVLFFFPFSASQAIEVGQEAPCVVLKDVQVGGDTIEQCIRTPGKEGDFVILEFSSVTCGACQTNLPILSDLAEDTKATATTRIIFIDRDEQSVHDYVRKKSDLIQFPYALDSDLAAFSAFDLVYTPTVVVLDQNNIVRFVHEGALSPFAVAKIKRIVK